MAIELNELCPKFTSIDNISFKRNVYGACLLFAMENYKNLRKSYNQDMFPSKQYYTLEDQLKGVKSIQKLTGPPKKKRTPVRKISSKELTDVKNDKESDDNTNNDTDETSETKSPEKEKRKTYPLILNRNAKSMIDFVINRFLWEVYHIEPSSDEECPETKSEIETYILEHVCSDFSRTCNISELIIHSVKIFQPSKIIIESYGLDKELRTKFDEHLDNTSFANVIAEYITDFVKLLMLFFTNRFWLEKSQTVNIKIFETIMRYIELSIPISCKTVSKGLMVDMINYDKLINSVKDNTNSSKTNGKKPRVSVNKKTSDPTDNKNIKPTDKKTSESPNAKKPKNNNPKVIDGNTSYVSNKRTDIKKKNVNKKTLITIQQNEENDEENDEDDDDDRTVQYDSDDK